MSSMPPPQVQKKDIQASLSYYSAPTPKDLTFDVSTPAGEKTLYAWTQARRSHYPFTIHDIRGEEEKYTLEKDHIQFVHQELPEAELEGKSDNEIIENLWPRAVETVRELTGATEIYFSKARVRKISGKFSYDMKQVQALHSVHTDRSALGVLHQFAHRRPDLRSSTDHTLNPIPVPGGRLWLLNVWRPFKTVTKDPLAWVDMSSVEEGDVCHMNMIHAEHWNGVGNVVHNPKHVWKYSSQQRTEEVMVFKQFDSEHLGGHAGVMPHSAIVDPDVVDESPRESIEFGILAWKGD